MQENITIRRATPKDIDFLTEAIIAAEKSGSQMPVSYTSIFSLTDNETKNLLKAALEEEIEGQELCHLHFLIAEMDGQSAATCASWVEGADGVSSGQIKANILFHLLGNEKWSKAAEALKAVAETNIERSTGAAQIESVYTRPEYRGRGLMARIIEAHLKQQKQSYPSLEKAQVILLKNNTSAVNAYRKAGFEQVAERTGTHPLLSSLLPCPIKIMMERSV